MSESAEQGPFSYENLVRNLTGKLVSGKTLRFMQGETEKRLVFRFGGERIEGEVAAAEGGVFMTTEVYLNGSSSSGKPDRISWLRIGDLGSFDRILTDYLKLSSLDLRSMLVGSIDISVGRTDLPAGTYPNFS
jgi:hypothetical protein